MTLGSLFSGVGGFELGLERAGFTTRWQVEIDPYARAVLRKHWPDVPKYEDVRSVGAHNLERVDAICGGFPCQDISNAGKRAGIDGERSGLWSEFARIIGELRPRYAIVENVAALLVRGVGRVCGDLADIGYDAEWKVVSAANVGTLHQRKRVLIVAYPRQERIQRVFSKEIQRFPAFSWCKDVRRAEDLRNRSDLPPPLFRGTRDGIPHWMDRVGCLGNAVVPQVAEYVGQCVMRHWRS